jgi:hypothetical protein
MFRGFFSLLVPVAFASTVIAAGVQSSAAHDVYTQLRSTSGQLCCGGDPVTGDCEAIGLNYRIEPDGTAVFSSARYGATVRIGRDKITWLPVPGGEESEAHWCGVPRYKVFLAPVNDENPDNAYWTYCAFIAPGGV